jgi:hypothetical protein
MMRHGHGTVPCVVDLHDSNLYCNTTSGVASVVAQSGYTRQHLLYIFRVRCQLQYRGQEWTNAKAKQSPIVYVFRISDSVTIRVICISGAWLALKMSNIRLE